MHVFTVTSVHSVQSHTCSCLMVSPPLPMTRPTLFAGMRICWIELLPSMSLWKPGPYRHCSTISLSSLLAWLSGEERETHLSRHRDYTQKKLSCVAFSFVNVKEVFRWFSDWWGADVKKIRVHALCVSTIGHTFSKSVKVERWDLLNVLWAPSQRAGPVQHASTVCNKRRTIN